MNLHTPSHPSLQNGNSLVTVLAVTAISAAVMASSLRWVSQSSSLIERNNDYFRAVAAAEACNERMLTEIMRDYQAQGAPTVDSKMGEYLKRRPKPAEDSLWSRYRFENIQGTRNRTTLVMHENWREAADLVSQYAGLRGYAADFSVVATARDLESRHHVVATVQQDFQLATLPLFQFAIFYSLDCEINPGPPMVIGGRVHANRNLYLEPNDTLTFLDDVTVAEDIYNKKKPGDPSTRSKGKLVFQGEHDGGLNTLNMPLGVENTPENARLILEPPPAGESVTSPLGQVRLYNQADLVIEVRDDADADGHPDVTVLGHRPNGSSISMSWNDVSSFVQVTNSVFFNKREGKWVQNTQIDVAKLRAWNAAGNPIKTAQARDVNSIYVNDQRAQGANTQPGVKVVNGAELPAAGLTIATPLPLYVQGNYNAPSSVQGTSDTTGTKPAAFIADAITVISGAWLDSQSASGLSQRKAQNTTVNAAFLAGIVETVNGSYSGGVENYPRFLEDWSGKTLTYNGSMVVLFPSSVATAPWRGTGSSIGIYNPPNRNWYFDERFTDPRNLPPLTPQARTAIRGRYSITAPRNYDQNQVAPL
jgi:hypothetical protein